MLIGNFFPAIVAAFFTSSVLIIGISYMVYQSREDKERGISDNSGIFHIEVIKYLMMTQIPFVFLFSVAFVLQEVIFDNQALIRAIMIIVIFAVGWIISWYLGKKYFIKMAEYSE